MIFSGISNPEEPGNGRPWKHLKTISGITIYCRRGADEGIHEFRALTVINSPSLKLYETITDIPSNRYWMADCVHSGIAGKTTDGGIIGYYISAPPWPLNKRDSVVLIRHSYNPVKKTGYFLMQSLAPRESEIYVKSNEKHIRIHRMNGSFVIRERRDGSSDVIFEISGESGEHLPDFIINYGLWRIPYRTLKSLKNHLGI